MVGRDGRPGHRARVGRLGGVADAPDAAPRHRPEVDTSIPAQRTAWLREILIVVGFYNVYQVVRGQADLGARARAFRHARWIVDIERATGTFFERGLQQLALRSDALITFTNTYYGTIHFLATGGVLMWLFFRRHTSYRQQRNTLGIMTLLGLTVFWFFPLAPPRMLPCNDSVPVAGPQTAIIGECFVDTLHEAGGVWSYRSPVAKAIANQFAAMPSLHFGWAVWCGLALFVYARTRTARGFGIFHITFTLFAVMATANHFWLDALGGVLVFLAAREIAARLQRSSTAEATSHPIDRGSELAAQ